MATLVLIRGRQFLRLMAAFWSELPQSDQIFFRKLQQIRINDFAQNGTLFMKAGRFADLAERPRIAAVFRESKVLNFNISRVTLGLKTHDY